jgi:hypothetical protein
MKKRSLNMKKPLAIAVVAAMMLGICPAAAPVNAADTDADYKYVYAGLNWEEYWKNEGVYLSGSDMTASSADKDTKGELDKGAFDVVTRATTNHGLHRGSFQCSATIYDKDGKTYDISYWTSEDVITKDEEGKDVTTTTVYAVLTDGSRIQFNKGNITYTEKGETKTAVMDYYEVKGIKYVPVAVKTEDYADFCQNYSVTEDEQTIQGGYSEGKLHSYSKTAEVTADTNGLKVATKNTDGSYSFSARTTGTGSGIKDEAQKVVNEDNIIKTVKEKDDAKEFGAFIRVDLTGDAYGDLGDNMQATRWEYYGNDSTYTNKLATYGTKFAADNWMHKGNGIQLGLTKSLRCQLPEGTDGTGYWRITVYALGYQDYTFDVKAEKANVLGDNDTAEEIDTTKLISAITEAEKLVKSDYTADSWKVFEGELAEAKDVLAAPLTQSGVDAATADLNAAIKDLVKVQKETETKAPETNTVINNDGNNNQTQTAYKAKVKLNSVKNTKGKKAVLKWKKIKNADGYVVYRATKKNGKYKAVKTIKKAKTVTFTDTKLKKGTTYYYKVKAYKKVNGKKALGQFSTVKSVKIKK